MNLTNRVRQMWYLDEVCVDCANRQDRSILENAYAVGYGACLVENLCDDCLCMPYKCGCVCELNEIRTWWRTL